MKGDFLKQINRPLFGTIVVPRNARVDPLRFSDSEFPLECPNCAYLLRGLSSDRCPECGEGFDRGRLLVQQYVERAWRSGEKSRLVMQAMVMVLLVLLPSLGTMALAAGGAGIGVVDAYWRVIRWAQIVVLAVILFSLTRDLRRWTRRGRQREAILREILSDSANPGTDSGQGQ